MGGEKKKKGSTGEALPFKKWGMRVRKLDKCKEQELNPRPSVSETDALPNELSLLVGLSLLHPLAPRPGLEPGNNLRVGSVLMVPRPKQGNRVGELGLRFPTVTGL